ncbi:HAD hydrolase-like protein [Streptomyces zaomyceticus]
MGRPAEQPHLMKPNPFPLITAAEQLHIDVTSRTLIGDFLTDIQAAHAAGATVIGYARKALHGWWGVAGGVDRQARSVGQSPVRSGRPTMTTSRASQAR